MPRIAPLLAASILALAGQVRAVELSEGLAADGFLTEIRILAGGRFLSGDWGDAGPDSVGAGGVQYQVRGVDWPAAITADFIYGEGKEQGVKVILRDLSVGFAYPMHLTTRLLIDVGAGGTLHFYSLTAANVDESVFAGSGYLQILPHYVVNQGLDVGALVRYGFGGTSSEIAGDINPGGLGVFAAVGMRF